MDTDKSSAGAKHYSFLNCNETRWKAPVISYASWESVFRRHVCFEGKTVKLLKAQAFNRTRDAATSVHSSAWGSYPCRGMLLEEIFARCENSNIHPTFGVPLMTLCDESPASLCTVAHIHKNISRRTLNVSRNPSVLQLAFGLVYFLMRNIL